MPTFRIPTPLRPYSGGNSQVAVTGVTVGDALVNLTDQYPDLRQHLYDGKELRSFVNIYLNQEDIRYVEGVETAVEEEDTLMIIPSIAGGNARVVDQSVLRVNQAFIIALLVMAFILGSWQLAAFVGFIMLLGTAYPSLGLFKQIYQRILRPAGLVKPDVIADNPEPHRFAQGFGGIVVSLAVGALIFGLSAIGWVLVWLVVLLAGLNLFLGFCAGCFIYYQLNRLDVPGFEHGPIR